MFAVSSRRDETGQSEYSLLRADSWSELEMFDLTVYSN